MKVQYLIIVIVVCALLVGCGAMIPAGSRGLANNAFGKPGLQEDTKEEGFYFQWPWNKMVVYDMTWKTETVDVDVLTADDLHVPTTVAVTYRPLESELYRLHTEIGQNYYEDVIRPVFKTQVRSEFARFEHNDLARESPTIEADIRDRMIKEFGDMPFEIGAVSVEHIRFDERVTKSISQKLAMEQAAEQKEFELTIAKEDAEIERSRARGHSDAIRIEAEGEAQSIILKADAQGKAQELITKTLTPNYLRYKAFDSESTRYYFVPIGKDGMPLLINTQ